MLERLGYRREILCSLWDFPWEMVYPCGCPVHYVELFSSYSKVLNVGCGTALDSFYLERLHQSMTLFVNMDVVFSILERSKRWSSPLNLANRMFWLCGDGLSMPFKDNTFEVVIMNGVFNLFEDKDRLLNELWRVLIPEGRIVVADIVSSGKLEKEYVEERDAWVWCIGGSLFPEALQHMFLEAGFSDIVWHEKATVDAIFSRAVFSCKKKTSLKRNVPPPF